MNLSTLILFTHLYAGGCSTPAYVNPAYSARTRVADFGFTIATPEWNHLKLTHSTTTYWVNDISKMKMVASVRYEVELRLRLSAFTLTAGHESWHNADIPGPGTQYNRVGIEVKP
jgi:hypothetical protein